MVFAAVSVTIGVMLLLVYALGKSIERYERNKKEEIKPKILG